MDHPKEQIVTPEPNTHGLLITFGKRLQKKGDRVSENPKLERSFINIHLSYSIGNTLVTYYNSMSENDSPKLIPN